MSGRSALDKRKAQLRADLVAGDRLSITFHRGKKEYTCTMGLVYARDTDVWAAMDKAEVLYHKKHRPR